MELKKNHNKVLLTTAISYTNGSPHIGHLYEAILADFIKRVYLLAGVETKLLTGTDEHGKKIQTTALEQGIKPIELCDKYSKEFEQMSRQLGSSYDHFIRTTDQTHKQLVTNTINSINKKDPSPIYLGEYSGYYNVREETYVTETQASQTNYCDPITSKPYEIVKEPTYYFVMKNFMDEIISTTNTLVPPHFQEEIKTRVEKGLEDLSITRTTFNWGIPYPSVGLGSGSGSGSGSDNHVIYVWFDALLNYVTGKNILFGNELDETSIIPISPISPISPIHLIGKDIMWFHSVIYPAILKASGYGELMPRKILVHGFVLDKEGKKMSKSLGNVITNQELFESYPVEAIRYYMISNTILGQDFKFDPENLTNLFNGVLINNFGNLFQRISKIAKPMEKELNEYLNKKNVLNQIKITQSKAKTVVENFLTNWDFLQYNNSLNELITNSNKSLTDKKPWALNNSLDNNLENELKIKIIGEIIIEFHSSMCLMLPIIPSKIIRLAEYWGWENKMIFEPDITLKFNIPDKMIAFSYLKTITPEKKQVSEKTSSKKKQVSNKDESKSNSNH
jgi:methionyl-tRNA synthetase